MTGNCRQGIRESVEVGALLLLKVAVVCNDLNSKRIEFGVGVDCTTMTLEEEEMVVVVVVIECKCPLWPCKGLESDDNDEAMFGD